MRHPLVSVGLCGAFALLVTVGCSKGSAPDEAKDKTARIEARADACALLTEALVRDVFTIPSETEVRHSENQTAKLCTYEWDDAEVVTVRNIPMSAGYYSVSLNFGPTFPNAQAANSAWESQNSSVFAEKELQDVSGVGDKASWSDLGGGQLRILSNNELIYLNHSARLPREVDGGMGFTMAPSHYDGMIELAKAAALAALGN